MIQTKLINILKQLPRTSAKETEKIVNRKAKSVEKIVDEFSVSDRATSVGSPGDGDESLLSYVTEYSTDSTNIDETPKRTKKDPVYFDKKDKRFQYKDKDRKNKKKKKKSKPISTPTPTPIEYAMYLQYNKKGIFFKTNLKDLNNRDKNGSVIINIGDE